MKYWLLLDLLFVALCSKAQGVYFNQRYTNDTTAYQSGITSVAALDSGYVTFGQANNFPFRGSKALMLRGLDRHGQQRWVRYYGQATYFYYSPGFGNGEALAQPDGGFAMAGTIESPPRNQWPMLWRFTATGDTLWTRTYHQISGAGFYAGCRTRDGGYALVGSQGRGASGTGSRGLLIRTDSAGNFLWMQQYGTVYATHLFTIYPTPDGGFLLSGNDWDGADGYLPRVIKTDSLGVVQWQRPFTFSSPQLDNGGATARPTRDGGYLVAATAYSSMVQGQTARLRVFYKLDSTGNIVWQHLDGPARVVNAFCVVHELADGSFVAAGQQCDADSAQTNGGVGYPEGFATKLCADGSLVWHRTYKILRGGKSHNYVRDFQPTPDGGFVGAGFLFTRAPDTGSSDSWVFRVDSAGYLRPNGPPVTASCGPVGLGEIEAPTPATVAVYPNPSADGRFTVQASPPAPLLKERGSYVVTDVLGRTVAVGALRQPETAVDLSAAPPGLYLLRLTWPDGRTTTRRLVRW